MAIGGSCEGRELSSPEFDPLWAKAEELQALVFAAAMRVKALQPPNRALRTFALLVIVVVLLIGFWIGARFRR